MMDYSSREIREIKAAYRAAKVAVDNAYSTALAADDAMDAVIGNEHAYEGAYLSAEAEGDEASMESLSEHFAEKYMYYDTRTMLSAQKAAWNAVEIAVVAYNAAKVAYDAIRR